MGFIVWVVCLIIQIMLSLEVFRRKDIQTTGKLVMILVIILVPYMLGAAFYYFYAKNHLTEWFK